jgi:hypothetical protein
MTTASWCAARVPKSLTRRQRRGSTPPGRVLLPALAAGFHPGRKPVVFGPKHLAKSMARPCVVLLSIPPARHPLRILGVSPAPFRETIVVSRGNSVVRLGRVGEWPNSVAGVRKTPSAQGKTSSAFGNSSTWVGIFHPALLVSTSVLEKSFSDFSNRCRGWGKSFTALGIPSQAFGISYSGFGDSYSGFGISYSGFGDSFSGFGDSCIAFRISYSVFRVIRRRLRGCLTTTDRSAITARASFSTRRGRVVVRRDPLGQSTVGCRHRLPPPI